MRELEEFEKKVRELYAEYGIDETGSYADYYTCLEPCCYSDGDKEVVVGEKLEALVRAEAPNHLGSYGIGNLPGLEGKYGLFAAVKITLCEHTFEYKGEPSNTSVGKLQHWECTQCGRGQWRSLKGKVLER